MMLADKKGLNGMIIGVLTIVIVVASVTILWGFISEMLTSSGENTGSILADLLKSLSPDERDTISQNDVNNGDVIYNLSCNDTDSMYELQGIERFILGNVTILNGTYSEVYSDYCIDNSTLLEYYCINNTMYSTEIFCEGENSCTEGRCDVGNLEYACYDSDTSEFNLTQYEIFIGGNLTLFNTFNGTISGIWKDSCDGINNITEYYCEDANNGYEISIECGQNSVCDNIFGACSCGGLDEICCPIQKGYVCSGNLECNNNVCVNVVSPSFCGDWIVQEGLGEECDDGNTQTESCNIYNGGCNICDNLCRNITILGPRCGDFNTQEQYGEECDDGNAINNDYCKNNCQLPYCGDNVCSYFEPGWCSDCYVPPPYTCFVGDTKIATPSGYKKIMDIKEGEVVLSYNEETGKIESSEVTKIFEHRTISYLIVNSKVKVTSNHPMHINGKWKEIGKAKIGDKLKTKDGEEVIKSIEIVNENIPVYNLEVEGNHNYFAENYLAHNKATGDCPEPPCIH